MGLTKSQQKQKEKQIKWWKEREEEQLKHYITQEAGYQRRIEEIYDYMMDQIKKEINGFYAKYSSKEGITMAEARKRISQLDIKEYERKAAKYVKNKTFTAEANEEMRLYNATMKINRLELLKANIGLELVDGFDDLQKYFDQILTDRTLEEFERQAGILGATIQENAKAAHAIVNASFHNATFSDRIWMYQDMMKAELSTLLQQGLIQGKNPRELARHLTKRFGVAKSNAERLMRTELARVQIEAQKQSFERNGYKEYEFIALGTACGICKELDGKHFKIKDMEIAKNAPPCHPNCRCSISAWMDREEFDKWLDSADEANETLKSIALDDVDKAAEGSSINSDVITVIKDTINRMGAKWKFDNVKVIKTDSNIVFNTRTTDIGTWCSNTLEINENAIGGKTVEEINAMFSNAPNTVCNSLYDGMVHEIYHAKLASSMNYAQYKAVCETTGIQGISKTAQKDISESIAEIGVLKERREYDILSKDAKEIYEKYLGR